MAVDSRDRRTEGRPARRTSLADSHVHLDRYTPREVAGLLGRARRAGVGRLLAVGVDLASSDRAIELARRHRGVRAAVGVHPNRVDPRRLADDLRALQTLADDPRVAAIGEVGLDADSARAPLEAQLRLLAGCLALAAERGLAVSLHVVGAHEQALALLADRPARRVVVHYFQGDARLAERYLALGCSISVGRPVTRPERAALRTAVARIPLTRLLLETDTYPLPGRVTEPADLGSVCAAVAELHRVGYETVGAQTSANYRRLLRRRRPA